MLFLSYKDFDELYFNLNKDVILNPQKYDLELDICSAYLPFTLIEVEENKCSLDLGKNLFYAKNKFNRLIDTYIDIEKLIQYKKRLLETRGTSLTFYFNQVKKKTGSQENNGPCLISFTLTRRNRSSKYNEINIYYRTCELGRRFGADLVLFYTLIKELPENCDINKIRMYISKHYFSTMTSCALIHTLGIDINKLDENNKIQKSILNQHRLMERDKQMSFSSRKIVQGIVKGTKEYKPINIEELVITKELSI